MSDYKILRAIFLAHHPNCNVCGVKCTKKATEVHHMAGKENSLLNDTRFWLPVCRNCHTWITEHSKEAIENGWSMSRHSKKINHA